MTRACGEFQSVYGSARNKYATMATMSAKNFPFKGFIVSDEGCIIIRALVHKESGLEYCLQKLPPQFVAEFRAQSSQGRAAHEQDNWETARCCFLQCKEMLSREGLQERLGTLAYHSLVAWVDLSLAQLYQAVGGVDTLEKVMELRKAILHSVMPLKRLLDGQVVVVCETYCCTAQYELGDALDSSKQKNEAMQRFSELRSCSRETAEAEICSLLCSDHEFLGRFKESLRWIQEANRARMKNPSDWNRCKFYFLEREAKLSMKLENFAEAVRVLKDLTNTFTSVYAQNPELPLSGRKVCEMLHECYMHMSRRASSLDDSQQAKEFEDLAEEQLRLIRTVPAEVANVFDSPFLGTSSLHPTRMATTSPLGGSGLGLTQAPFWKGADLHLSKLPKPIMVLLEYQRCIIQYLQQRHDWETAILWSECVREVLKMTKRCLASGTYDWLLSWVDLPLALLYHYYARNFDKALEMWKEIQECSVRNSASTDKLEFSSTDYQISLAALGYELSLSNTSVQENCDILRQKGARQNCTSEGMLEMTRTLSLRGKHDIIQKWARAYCTSEEKAEEDLCFWLYFGYYCHGKFQRALEWLQTSKNLRLKGHQMNGGCRRKRGPRIDYFCCDYDYNRCEIDLFTKLERHDEAASALESLLHSKECIQETGIIDCIDNDHLDGESILGQLPTPSPTATGCILLELSTGMLSFRYAELVQSSVGLEHHLLKLPFPIQLAFRKHSSLGRLYNLEWMDWENAIFHFEWCLEILETLPTERSKEFKRACDWLEEWVIPPLAYLYAYMKKQHKTAFDLWIRMVSQIRHLERADREAKRELEQFIFYEAYATLYLCAITDYPSDSSLKNYIIKSGVRMLGRLDDWTMEYEILRYLLGRFMTVYANYEGALDFVRRMKQLLDQWYPEPAQKMTKNYLNCVLMEAMCLWHLQRRDEIERVKHKFWESTGKNPTFAQNEVMKTMDLMGKSPQGLQDFFKFLLNGDFTDDPTELLELRQKSDECVTNKQYSKAISYREDCLRLIQENPSLEGLENPQDVSLGFKDNLRIADLHLLLLVEVGVSPRKPIKGQDEDFVLAVNYYMKCLRQLSTGPFPIFRRDLVASLNVNLLHVYFMVWAQYDRYLESCRPRMLTSIGSCDEDESSMQEQDKARCQALIQDYLKEVKTFLEWCRKLPFQKLGERTIWQFTRSLHTMGRKQYTEGWIEWLEHHKFLYARFQAYHGRTASLISCLQKSPFCTETETEKLASQWNAFLFSERERTRVMMYQLEMHRRKSLGSDLLQWDLDAHDSDALKYIKESCRTLLDRESAVFVQYSSFSYSPPPSQSPSKTQPRFANKYFVYVIMIDKDGCQLFMEFTKPLDQDEGITKSTKRLTPEKRLSDLYEYLAYKQRHPEHKEICKDKENRRLLRYLTITSDESMNEYLEFLYGALLGPVAHHLEKVKPGDKLVLSPTELLTRVPFAALRNPKDGKYLIESHAIAIAPSLRVLQMCSERLQGLQRSSYPFTGRPGSVIALGDPTYNQCDACSDSNRADLKATGKEVDKIVAVFGDTAVTKLTKTEATAKRLLEWAAKPSQESFRQAIVHVGAHGVIDDSDNHRNNHLQLACGTSVSTVSANSASSSSSTRGKPDDEQIEDNCSDDDVSDSEAGLVTEDDSNHVRSLIHQIISTRFLRTEASVTNDGSSSSRNDAKIKRSSGPVASSHDLTVDDINNLETRWNAELLVLSACQTSAGRTTLEGVLSLARAFMAAGVPCVVASLWKVDDGATFDLMECFYDELWKGSDVASALQRATLNSMEKDGHDAVQYWAPFNVLGVPSLRIPKELQKRKSKSTESVSGTSG